MTKPASKDKRSQARERARPDLLARLEAAGAVEARGGFSIDPEKAREKLRQYQLADPNRYVLLLVEAAFSNGATSLEFEVDSDDLHLRFDGSTFAYEQLENIYGALFTEVDELRPEDLARMRGLAQLAFAVNSAMAINPRYVRITSIGDDGEGTLLELRPDQPDELTRVQGEPGNWIHVKDSFRPGLIVEFFRSLGDTLDEVVLLRAHCRWSRRPVVVNGAQVSGPMTFEWEPWTSVEVTDEGEPIGQAAIGLSSADLRGRPRAFLVSNGVFIEELALDERAVAGFEAIVDSPRFGKDVSQTKLLHDAGYDAVIDRIIAAQDHAIARLAERYLAQGAPSWADDMLIEWLTKHANYSRPSKLRRALIDDPLLATVAEVPLWPVVGAANISTRALIEAEGPLRHASEDFEFAPVDVPFVLRIDPGPAQALLEQLFGARLHDYTPALRREWERQRCRLQFMTRRHLPELGEGYYLIREPIRGELRAESGDDDTAAPIRGELGLRSLGHGDSWVRLLTEGCLLRELALDGPVPGLCAVVSAPLEPNEDYDQARATRSLAAALVAVLEALERAITKLAGSGAISPYLRALLRTYVAQACQADFGPAFLDQFGFARRQARREVKRLGAAITPRWGLDGPAEDHHELLRVPLYDRAHGEPASLAELAARVAQGQRLAWLEAGTRPLPALDAEVLLLEQADREALRALLGKDVLAPFAERLAQLRRRDAFLECPQAELALPHASLVRVELRAAEPELRGALGLREYAFTAATEGQTPVQVYYRARKLCHVELELPLPGLCAWVESEALEIAPSFEALAHPLSLRGPLLEGLVALVELELERARAAPDELLRCEWWFLTMVPGVVLGPGRLAQAFVWLRHELGLDAALTELAALLELLERYPRRDLDRAIGSLRGRGELPTAEAVRGRLRRPNRRISQAEQDLLVLRRGLLPAFTELLELPLLRRLEPAQRGAKTARTVPLDQLFARVGAGEPISWVADDFHLESKPTVTLEVSVLDPVEQNLLDRLLGSDGLELVSDWLIGRARFERRRTISEIRVARGSAIVLLPLSSPGVRGELGISRESPSQIERSKIRVFTESREVAVVELPARPVALVGAIEFDELELNEAHTDITSRERERVRKLVRAQTDALLTELATRYSGLNSRDKGRAAELVRHLLVGWPPGVGGYQARAAKRPAMFKRLAGLAVFAGARKPWSALELAEARERGRIASIAYRRPSLELPDTPVVVLDAPDVEAALEALFGDVRDLDREIERRRELAARKANSPRMPSQPPDQALLVVEVEGEDLEGWLWLADDQAEVLFGADGHVADKRVISDLCWCGGAVWGEGLSITSNWSRATLTRAQERLLQRLAAALWDRLIDEFERRVDAEAPRDRDARRLLSELRERLHDLFMRLHPRCARKRRSKRKRKRKGNRYEQLYERLRTLAVLELSTGRWISAETAERERPLELASLKLWSGPSAEEIAHQRAVERRESKRARERERQQQREREQQRRRAEAEARKREAQRRRRAAREAEREREAAAKLAAAGQAQPKKQAKRAERAKSKGARAKPRAPLPEELLLEALREELRLVRAANAGLVSNHHLESLVLGEPVRRGPLFRHADGVTEIDVGHPLFEAVLAGYLDDQGLLTLLASSAYTYLNIIHVEIEDQHEAEFLRLHAAHAATGGL
ncbi:hypothetical protein ENSA5_27160 [Enhygromyxa salina]|uniref:Uncharacterized protein n=1 Tax=Enhygromyxa salina TaxID=215803 RepID=A0A2S9Y7F7_9BACT|nr:hypothetical protein [Enhygromyxa salina]PRQ01034.1 hypothetical protein ENSA5_27160 [Enhygromyxa salina]